MGEWRGFLQVCGFLFVVFAAVWLVGHLWGKIGLHLFYCFGILTLIVMWVWHGKRGLRAYVEQEEREEQDSRSTTEEV